MYATQKKLQEKVSFYEAILKLMQSVGIPLTVTNFDNYMANPTFKPQETQEADKNAEEGPKEPTNFISFFYDELAAEKIDLSTRKQRIVVYKSLLAYGRIKEFADLTPKNILNYHKWLKADGTRSDVTLKFYHKRLHRYVIKAYEYGYIDRDPYKIVTIPSGHSPERRPLTEEELLRLLNLKLKGKEDKVRDLFIFSAFTGLAYCDAQAFDYNSMTEQHGNIVYIDGNRIKTGSNYFTPILPPAMNVLRKYNYRLPRMSNQKLNDYLHVIEAKMELTKPLSSHLARHTFATWVLAHDVPIENVARMLGHKDVKTTQIYAKILKTTIVRHAETLCKDFPFDNLCQPMAKFNPFSPANDPILAVAEQQASQLQDVVPPMHPDIIQPTQPNNQPGTFQQSTFGFTSYDNLSFSYNY